MKYFTTKVASAEAFCGREKEQRILKRYIEDNEHCVVVAPRRYGKTSLIMQVIELTGMCCGQVDLFCVVYEEEVMRKLAKGVSQIAQGLMSRTEKTLSFLEKTFKSAKIGIHAGSLDISVEMLKTQTLSEQVEELLLGLEQVAKNAQKKVVLFIDEFQDILKVERSLTIQAAIRSVAQHSKYVTYIFSGSSRVMLEKIFDDTSQPLYMMCHKLSLHRIGAPFFEDHIQKAALATWGRSIDHEALQEIIELTECHTYYVNLLCADLMALVSPPAREMVVDIWQELLHSHRGKIISELEKLSPNRIKVLTNIALLKEVNEPNSRRFLNEVKISLSSAQASIQYLLENDYIYETRSGALCLLDPLMRTFIMNRYCS